MKKNIHTGQKYMANYYTDKSSEISFLKIYCISYKGDRNKHVKAVVLIHFWLQPMTVSIL